MSTASPLCYGNLNVSANYAIGGNAYLTAGRGLDVSSTGPFSSYLNNGQIGQAGTTLYMSALLRKDSNNDQEVSLSLHDSGLAWCSACASSVVGAGYFGSYSNTGGTRYWSLKVGGSVYTSNIPVNVCETTLLVLRIDFGATTTVSLYVNPTSPGGSEPTTANVQQSTTNTVTIQSLAYYGGDGTNQSSLDEIRFGSNFAAVTPVN